MKDEKENDMNEPKTIELTPNFKGIFAATLREAMTQAKDSHMFTGLDKIPRYEAAALRDVQRWFAPLSIAINAASSVGDIEQVREAMADILSDINKAAAALEAGGDGDAEYRAEMEEE